MYQLPVNNLGRIRRARKQVKRTLGEIGLEICKEAAEDFKDFCPDEQFVQDTLYLDICAWDPSYSKAQAYRSKPFCCSECSFSSKYYSGYKNHFRNVHRKIGDNVLLNCPYCTFTASKRNMEVHIRIFHQSRLPQHSPANAVGMQPNASSQQSAFRQKDNTFQTGGVQKAVYFCKKCTFRDSLYNVVRRHIYREHFQHVVAPYLAMASSSSVKNGGSSINSNTILCKRCQFSTRSYEALVQHVVEYHERIGAQITAMVGHANMVVGKPQASTVIPQKTPIIMRRTSSSPADPGVQPVIGYLKSPVTKTYSSSVSVKVSGPIVKASLGENNVPLINTAQTQKWKICTVCNELFPENLYSAHFESAHKAKKVWALAKYIMKIHNFTSKCLLCNRYLPSDTLLNHVLIHGLTCPQCHSAFHSVEKLIEHGNVSHMAPFEGPPGASPLTFDLSLKQDKSCNVQLLVLTFNTSDSVNGQEETLPKVLPLATLPSPNMIEKKSQPLAKHMFPSLSAKTEVRKTLCPLCFTVLKGPISDVLALHLRQRHQVLQTMHPVEKKMTYKCIHCLGVYTSNMVASTITLHLVQCRAVGRNQAGLSGKSPLTLGTSGAGLLKRPLPMQGTSNPKRMNLGVDSTATSSSHGQFDGLALDPSKYEHQTYEARKEFLTAYFNRRPYVSALEKEILSTKLWLWKADIACHFSSKQRLCERQCEKSKVSVLLGFDMEAVKKVKHDLIFGEYWNERASTLQKDGELKSQALNPDQNNSTLKPGVCMETICIDSDSEPETDGERTEDSSDESNQQTVNEPYIAPEIEQTDAEDEMQPEGEVGKPVSSEVTYIETNLLEPESTEDMEMVPEDEPELPADEMEPLPSDDMEPLPSDEMEPLPSDEMEPLPSDEMEPLPSDEMEPLPTDEMEPLPSDELEPVSDEDILKTLEHMRSASEMGKPVTVEETVENESPVNPLMFV